MEGKWEALRTGTVWREEWGDLARQAMDAVLRGSTRPSGRQAAAEFAAGVWARFVSQFEPDRSSWDWTAAQCSRAMPDGMSLELGPVRPNKPYTLYSGFVTQASGDGQYIVDVHFPGCVVRDADGHVLQELGAAIVKGDRL